MPNEQQPLKVFLCHAHADRDPVHALYNHLTADGVDAWLDKEKLLPGQNWEYEIRKAVRKADVVIVCLSKQFNQAGFRQKEVRWALDTAMEQPEGSIFIIPARLEECENLESLEQWQWVDLFAADGYDRLMYALQARAGRIGATLQQKKSELPKAAVPRKGGKQTTTKKPGESKPPIRREKKDGETVKPKPAKGKARQKLHPAITAALIGAAATVIAALLTSPLWTRPTPAPTLTVTAAIPSLTDTSLPFIDIPSPATATEEFQAFPPMETTSSSYSSTDISLVDSFPAPGIGPAGIAWDGNYLWLPDNSGVIFKMDASGKVLDSFQAPDVTPDGLAWDGSSFWVFTTNNFLVYRFQYMEGNTQVIHSFKSPAEGFGDVTDMTWDGKNIWYAYQFKVYQLNVAGEVLGSFTFPRKITGLDWDGAGLWIAYDDFPDNAILSRVNTAGETLDTYASLIFEIDGLAWGDDGLWVLGVDELGGDPMVYKLDISIKEP